MAKTLDIYRSKTLFGDEVPYLTVTNIGQTPYKLKVKISPMMKAKVKQGDLTVARPIESDKEFVMSLGDIIEIRDGKELVELMPTRLYTQNRNSAYVRFSCRSSNGIIFSVN